MDSAVDLMESGRVVAVLIRFFSPCTFSSQLSKMLSRSTRQARGYGELGEVARDCHFANFR